MTFDSETVNTVAGYIALAAAVPLLATTTIYGIGSPWYKSALGRTIFAQWLSMVLVFAVILGRRYFGEYPGYEWVALGAYSLLFASFTATTIIVIIERRAAPGHRKDTATMSHVAVNKTTVPPIWYRWQRVLRTALTTTLTVLPLVPQVIEVIQGHWQAGWLTGVGVQAILINSALTAIIALPTVNAWLTKVGLGSVPRKAVTSGDVVPIEPPAAG